jgi:sugar phosphate permease
VRVSAFTIGFLLFVPDLVPSPASADCTAAHLQSVGSVSLDEALGVAVAGNFAYVGADYAGFLVVDISD